MYKSGYIRNLINGVDEYYEIILEDEDDQHARQVQRVWAPILFKHAKEAKASSNSKEEALDLLEQKQIQDFHWDWTGIANQEADGYTRKTFYFLVNDGVEGVLHAYFPKESRLNSTQDHIVYVDFVAVSPWNREPIAPQRKFKGVGTKLLRTAINYSHEAGYDGCIGLHSLPQATGFYEALGMHCLDVDESYEGLKYFEMDVEVAHQNLARMAL